MATPAPSWNDVRVHGTWVNQDGTLKAGSYKVVMPVRVTNATDDVIIPAGTFATGTLNTTPGPPSMDLRIPASDDPDNLPLGFQPTITVTFLDAPGELYVLTIPVALKDDANGINLRTVILSQTLPTPVPFLMRGVANGVAALNADGDVVDADGNVIDAGSGFDDASAINDFEGALTW